MSSTHVWSAQQEEIFQWFETSKITITDRSFNITDTIETVVNNLIVRARAGCAKTTSIIEGVQRMPEAKTGKVLVCSFSKEITEELAAKLGNEGKDISKHALPNIEAKTLHAVGYACIMRYRTGLKLSNNTRAANLAKSVCGTVAPDAIVKLVAKLCTMGREIKPYATQVGELSDVQITFECEPDAAWGNCRKCGDKRAAHVYDSSHTASEFPSDHAYDGFDAQYVEEMALKAMELAANIQSGDEFDFADMLFLPVRNNWLTPIYDAVVVDEAQDMTNTQLILARGVAKPNGRVCVVGDDRQAIYGFRGADSGSLDRLKSELNAAELGLKITYRCGALIVDLAKTIVPDYQAAPNNHLGTVRNMDMSKLVNEAGPGDFILSRVNAPLVSVAMQLLRSGKRARVAGRDIGAGLRGLVRKFKATSVPMLLARISAWEVKEVARLEATASTASNGRKEASKAKIEAVRDQADMLISLAEGAKNVGEVEDRIEALFTDDGLGAAGVIICSSVHKAKGKEAGRVFVLADTLRSHTVEELNITYVAYTRAKHTLVLVTEGE